MNIGVCIRHDRHTLKDQLVQGKQHGFQHIQLVSWDKSLWTEEEADRVGSLLAETGITATAFWCGWEGPRVWDFLQGPGTLGIVPPAWRAARVSNLLDGAAFAGRLGIRDIVTHAGFIPEWPGDPDYPGVVGAIRELARAYREKGQNFLFETGQETPVTLLRCIEDAGLDNLFVNLDPANLIMYGKANPLDALEILGHLVRGVHAKDGLYPVDGRKLGRETKVGEGRVDFPRLIRRLRELGYEGSLTIEREISGPQQLADILDTQGYLASLIQGRKDAV
ncbi:MAG: sugar phosphate isomerase/epimerase family protein [Christensenellales bacterium]